MGGGTALFWILCLILPAAIGVVVALAKPPEMVSWINDRSDGWDRYYGSMAEKSGVFAGIWGGLMWGVHKLHVATSGIEDEAVKAGLRVGFSFCIAALSIVILLSLIYIAVGIAVIAAGFWVLNRFMEDEGAAARRRARARAERLEEAQDQPFTRRDGRSRRRTDASGNEYTEHLREDGSVASRSEIKKDWLGNSYIETRNDEGEVVETATVRDGLFETYVEHRDGEGDKVGRSHHRDGWFGDEYVQHQDTEGTETGRSRSRTDRSGRDYTEHERRD
jgi:hypothetical protein